MATNDKLITDLMKDIEAGKIQLPDFQRDWIWDDNRIRGLIASITRGFPIGAVMFLQFGNESIRFKSRTLEGVPTVDNTPDALVLDGQQRLTSIYAAMCNSQPVNTRTEKGEKIEQYYYIDIAKALNPSIDRMEAIISVPKTKKITSDFGRKIELDVTSKEKEYQQKLFPLNIILNSDKSFQWEQGYTTYHQNRQEIFQEYMAFRREVIGPVNNYQIPVISLSKETPKEAVCQVFENVNQGGVSLTVFELVTASFAMSDDDFKLRDDWEKRKQNYFNRDLLFITTATDFLMACTILASYQRGGAVSCKRKDVLNLTLEDYKKYADSLTQGFVEAEMLLQEERIFVYRDLPYTTQIIPLAVLCTLLNKDSLIKTSTVKNKIKQWYWCGVLGELYGGANETRYVNDVIGVMDWVLNDKEPPKTVQEAYFNPTRLLTLQSRQSAAYKGIMALIMKNHSKDFISGQEMDFANYKSANIDIHHIFPQNYCKNKGYDKQKWNSIINKTPLSYSTNREIGGVAPSQYLAKLEKKGKVRPEELPGYLETHWISNDDCRSDDFYHFIIHRAGKLLDAVSAAMGKPVVGRDSEEVRERFGEAL